MNGRELDARERARRLMMAALDDELEGGERGELDHLLAEDAALRREWEQLKRVKEVTSTMALTDPPEEVWEDYWTSAYSRFERGIGWILVSIAALVLLGFGLWEASEAIVASTELPGFVKIALFVLFFGAAILGVSVLREKWFVRRRDPYKEIRR